MKTNRLVVSIAMAAALFMGVIGTSFADNTEAETCGACGNGNKCGSVSSAQPQAGKTDVDRSDWQRINRAK
ncbi:MAG TPA: hypothetical protein VGJ94_15015 [Syntrophorhabdaceae bacterium]